MKTDRVIVAESQHHCVVYNKSDGRIVHGHSVLVLPGADAVGKDEVESRALRIAKSKGYKESDLSVVHIDRGTMRHDEKYKVDLKSRQLVSEGKVERFGRRKV